MSPRQRTSSPEPARMGRIGDRPYWVLNLSICIRAVHQVGAAVFLAAYLLQSPGGPPAPYLALAMLSGTALLFTEWLRHRQIHRELSGLAVILKLLVIGAAFHGILPETGGMLVAFLLASIASHAPKALRHRLLY